MKKSDYLCTMFFRSKNLSALFFALLIVYISVAFPLMPGGERKSLVSEQSSLAFESHLDKVIYFQGPSAPVQLDGWKTEAKVPGLIFRKTDPIVKLFALPGMKNRLIIDQETWTPVQQILLYPYHEFI
ncbi:MAG TPA: hypothetical protein DCY35_01010 [Prolixibacteraceae bacterium]|nr:hypothetical protein [Prolixibacteraceae bacterium]